MRRWLPFVGVFGAVLAGPRDSDWEADGRVIVICWGRLQLEIAAGWESRR